MNNDYPKKPEDLNARIDAWFDGDLDATEASQLFQELSRHPEAFERVVADQAWIDELTRPFPSALVPDVAPDVFERLGLDPAAVMDADEQPAPRSPFVLSSLARRLAAAAVVAVGVGFLTHAIQSPETPAPPLRLSEGSPLETGIETVMADINPVRQMVGSVSGAVNAVATFVNNNAAEPEPELPPLEISFEMNQTTEKWRRSFMGIRDRVDRFNRFRDPGPTDHQREQGSALHGSHITPTDR